MKNFLQFKDWNEKLANCDFLLIAGPCAAENQNQMLQTAIALEKIPQVKVFRSGIWKPRTKPNDFNGVGEIAFDWLSEIKKNTSLLTCVEVANQHHVIKCLENNIDILWIGARTTVNPFYVQEIANSVTNKDTAVLIKNPITPDLKLWIGAIERIQKAGIKKIAAVLRGFHPFENSLYRNVPKWDMIVDLKTHFPTLPIIIDPSHIAGKRELVEQVMQQSLPFCPDGFMIEVHNCPENALSDAKQQITPTELDRIIFNLNLNCNKSKNYNSNLLNTYREIIDSIDYQLIELMAKRFNIVEKIGKFKIENNLDIFQVERWRQIVKSRLEYSQKLNIDSEFSKKMMQLIHLQSIEIQSKIVNNYKKNKK